jgi:hypothetical protein
VGFYHSNIVFLILIKYKYSLMESTKKPMARSGYHTRRDAHQLFKEERKCTILVLQTVHKLVPLGSELILSSFVVITKQMKLYLYLKVIMPHSNLLQKLALKPYQDLLVSAIHLLGPTL